MTAVCATLVLAGCATSSTTWTVSGTPVTERPAAERPPATLDGLYAIEWVDDSTFYGTPPDEARAPRTRHAWAYRTACDAEGCIATGGSIADVDDFTAPLQSVRVADYADGHWVSTSEREVSCTAADGATRTSNVWVVWDIAVDSAGGLAPTVTMTGTDDCPFIAVHRPTMTRGDGSLHGVPVPDPADQPAPAVPAGAGFDGDYTVTRTPRGRADNQRVSRHEVTTHCLREEPRCVTMAVNPEAPEDFSVLQFDGDEFGRRSAAVEQPCGTGDAVAEVTETLRPDGTSAPLRTLTGERIATFRAGCPGSVVDDVEYALADD